MYQELSFTIRREHLKHLEKTMESLERQIQKNVVRPSGREKKRDRGERKEIGKGLGAVWTDGKGVLEHLGQRNGVKSLRNGRDF